MSEQLTGPQDAPEGFRATTTSADPSAARTGDGAVPAALYTPEPQPVPVQSQGRTETYDVEGPDGRMVRVTRDLDTGEQTTTHPDGRVFREGPHAQQANSLATPSRLPVDDER
jgi:hypothetical protein